MIAQKNGKSHLLLSGCTALYMLATAGMVNAQSKYSADLTVSNVKQVVNDAAQWQIKNMPVKGRTLEYNPQYKGWADGVFLSALADWAAYDNSWNFIEWYEDIAYKNQWEVGHRSLNPANDIAVSLAYAKIWMKTNSPAILFQ